MYTFRRTPTEAWGHPLTLHAPRRRVPDMKWTFPHTFWRPPGGMQSALGARPRLREDAPPPAAPCLRPPLRTFCSTKVSPSGRSATYRKPDIAFATPLKSSCSTGGTAGWHAHWCAGKARCRGTERAAGGVAHAAALRKPLGEASARAIAAASCQRQLGHCPAAPTCIAQTDVGASLLPGIIGGGSFRGFSGGGFPCGSALPSASTLDTAVCTTAASSSASALCPVSARGLGFWAHTCLLSPGQIAGRRQQGGTPSNTGWFEPGRTQGHVRRLQRGGSLHAGRPPGCLRARFPTGGVDAVMVQVVGSQLGARCRQLGPHQGLVANLAHASDLAKGAGAGAAGHGGWVGRAQGAC